MSTHKSARGLATACAMLMFGGIAHADCKWPAANAIEERHREPVVVAGVPFVSERYSYFLPSYRIASLRCTQSINWGPRGWQLSLAKETTPLHQITGAPNRASSLPPLPKLESLPPLPRVAPLPQIAPLPPLPDLEPLSKLPSLPPVPPL